MERHASRTQEPTLISKAGHVGDEEERAVHCDQQHNVQSSCMRVPTSTAGTVVRVAIGALPLLNTITLPLSRKLCKATQPGLS